MFALSLRPSAARFPGIGRILRPSPIMVGMEPTELDETRNSALIQIFAHCIWFEEDMTMSLRMSDPVAMVKAHIENATNIPPDAQELFFDTGIPIKQEKLVDTEPLSSYNIGEGATLEMWLAISRIEVVMPIPLIEAQTGTRECFELMRKYEQVGNVGCTLCWCWMSPSSEESHWSGKKHGKRLQAYTGRRDPFDFKEVKMSEEG